MPDYKTLYLELFNELTEIYKRIEEIQKKAEKIYIESAEESEAK